MPEHKPQPELEEWVRARLGAARAKQRSGRETYGRTWWGTAWVAALEQRARLDPNRLPRGRAYARQRRVGRLLAEPGEVRAPVVGTRTVAYRVRVRVRRFSDDEWDRALDAVAARAGHAAALLDGELSPEVAADLAGAGIDLLPGPGEVTTSCSCPDVADPCKHAAAVCYLVAGLLDEDPFTLLLLRGRTRDEVLAGLRSRRGRPATKPSSTKPGLAARDLRARATAAATAALPRPPLPPAAPGHPAPLAVDPPEGSGLSSADLLALAADASERAWQLATGAGDGGLGLSEEADLARRAAAALGTPRFTQLAARSRVAERQLVRLATAWASGGEGALEVLGPPWNPPPEVMEEARAIVAGLLKGQRVRANENRLSGGDIHLRYGRDGRWYRCERRGGGWDVVAPPSTDPAALVNR
ncbi:MAG: SWIM zinc finger family protein [Acidimicrobiales bacterium]